MYKIQPRTTWINFMNNMLNKRNPPHPESSQFGKFKASKQIRNNNVGSQVVWGGGRNLCLGSAMAWVRLPKVHMWEPWCLQAKVLEVGLVGSVWARGRALMNRRMPFLCEFWF